MILFSFQGETNHAPCTGANKMNSDAFKCGECLERRKRDPCGKQLWWHLQIL